MLGFSLHASLTSDMQMYGLNLSAEMIGSITVSRDTILKLSLGSYVNSWGFYYNFYHSYYLKFRTEEDHV